MQHTNIVDPNIYKLTTEFTLRDKPCYVRMTDFEGDSLHNFVLECNNVLNTQQFLPIVVDSYGGQVYTAFGIIDFLQSLQVPIYTICATKAMSAGALLFSCGEKRILSPNAHIMIHGVSGGTWGKADDVIADTNHQLELHDKIFKILDTNTGKKTGYWEKQLALNGNADLFLNAKQAKKMGLATHVGIPVVKTEVSAKRNFYIK